jgi:putative hydrolase of the HAD superfamily
MDNDNGFGRRGDGSSATTDLLSNGLANGGPPGAGTSSLGVDAIVLDIDDTLYLERDYVRSGFEAVGRWAHRELGVDDFADRAWAAFESGARNTIFDEVLTACGAPTDDATITELVARYRTHPPSIVLAADAEAGLDRWHGAAALAAITDGPLSSQQAKARALGLERWTSTVVFTASLGPGKGKPDPAAFELVQEELGVGGKSCVYVADNPAKDFVGPKALGWRTVRVRRRLGLHVDVDSGTDVDHEITTLEQLDAVLAP